jgi:hypothetical protein
MPERRAHRDTHAIDYCNQNRTALTTAHWLRQKILEQSAAMESRMHTIIYTEYNATWMLHSLIVYFPTRIFISTSH